MSFRLRHGTPRTHPSRARSAGGPRSVGATPRSEGAVCGGGAEDARHVFDELLRQGSGASMYSLNGARSRRRRALHPRGRCVPLQPHGPSRRRQGKSSHRAHLWHPHRLLLPCGPLGPRFRGLGQCRQEGI
ncbi:hypothetical protein EE612_052137 [Oryza sativa]|nr:hypothetical protein EE612_052137 [Oryza sativa]